MRHKTIAILLAAAALVTLVWARTPVAPPAQETPQPCCFTHLEYAGVCEVTPAEGESCASILRYLNTPMSTGKSYCGGTTIRGGWEPAACDDPEK